jgi:CubicO group peptidase (beta-lactamase class C family)
VIGGWPAACVDGQPRVEQAEAPARPRYVETRETISRLADDLIRVNDITGLSLALVDGDAIVWAAGFGMADVDLELAAGPRTVYEVGSIAKAITVAAVLQAVERGGLDLDATLAELLPELDLAGDAEQHITLEQLLTHQSGLPSDWFVHSLSQAPPPWIDIVGELEGLELAAPPGTLTLYSNLGLTLAGAALERASGRPYAQVVSEELLRPAGMRTAYFVGGPEPEPVLLPIAGGARGLAAIEQAAAYRHRKLRSAPEFRMAPAGGLHASVLDLAAFASVVLGEGSVRGRRLLAPESVEAMLTAHNEDLSLDLDQRFGYAWFLDHPRLGWAGRVAWHPGRTYYHHAQLIVLPDHGLAVAVASNSLTAGSVVDTLAVETLISALQEKHELDAPSPTPAVEHAVADAALVEAFLQRHAGDYATSVALSRVDLLDGEVWSQAGANRSRLTLDHEDGGTVEALAGSRLRFLDVEGLHMMVLERDGVRRRSAVRLADPEPIPPAWKARVGSWKLIERPGEVSTIREPSLRIIDGRLRLECLGLLEHPPLPLVMVLRPLDDRRARIEGLSRGQGTIVEIRGEGEDERLWWLGRELRRAE